MAFYDDILSVFDKYGIGLPPHLAQQLFALNAPPVPSAPVQAAVTLPAGCRLVDVPNAPKCLVALDGEFAADFYGHRAWAIQEVAECFPVGSPERTFVEAQVEISNEFEGMGALSVTVCRGLLPNGRAGGDIIQGTFRVPSKDRDGNDKFRTVAETYAWFSKLPDPEAHSDNSGFHS
jgi:hypothetical protein